MRRIVLVGLAALLAAACTNAPETRSGDPTRSPAAAAPSPTSSASPEPSPPPSVAFDADAARALVADIVAFGPRETTTRAYRRASKMIADRFAALGYAVRFQDFDVLAGAVDGVAAPAGSTRNVVAEPSGFDPARAFVVVGGHLDSVPDSQGANDNASGVAVTVELARLASIEPPPMQIVFVAFAAEERRRQSRDRSQTFLGAQAYVDALDEQARAGLRGMINLDMVGNGDGVLVLGDGPLVSAARAAGRRTDVEVRPTTLRGRFSDHEAFEAAGYPVAWLWAGDHPSLHTPRDRLAVVQAAQLERVGRVAWEMLNTLRLS